MAVDHGWIFDKAHLAAHVSVVQLNLTKVKGKSKVIKDMQAHTACLYMSINMYMVHTIYKDTHTYMLEYVRLHLLLVILGRVCPLQQQQQQQLQMNDFFVLSAAMVGPKFEFELR